MTDRELLKQALDALEYASDETKPKGLYGCECLICKTILALRDRLAQPETPDTEFTDEQELLERFADIVAAHEREQFVAIVLDNSDAEGICCTDDVLEAFRQRR